MKFFCGNCRAKLEVDDSASGMLVDCPNCSTKLMVPVVKHSVPKASEKPVADSKQGVRTGELDETVDHGMTISQFMSRKGLYAGKDLDGGTDIQSDVVRSQKGKKYAVGDMVAKGGMGGILKARDLNVRRQIAMKVLLEGKDADDDDIIRFVEEAQITGQLEHPNITPVHELGVDSSGNIFFTMKLIKGRSLSEILTDIREGDLHTITEFQLTHLVNIFLKICDAVAFAHSKGVVHRDLKPENVMVGEFGEVLVIDWGIAKILDPAVRQAIYQKDAGGKREMPKVSVESVESFRQEDATQHTMVGTIVGTAHFMAPEQAYGRVDDIDERSDIYALGGILYNILALCKPIEGDDVKNVLMKVVEGRIKDPLSYNPTGKRSVRGLAKTKTVELRHCPDGRIPNALAAVAMKALSLEKQDRYESVPSLQKEIEKWQTGFATEAEEAGLFQQLRLLIKRHKPEFAMASIALCVVIGVVALSFLKVRGEMLGAESARDEAKEALGALKSTAPSFYGLAVSQVENDDLSKALENVNYAISLAPEEPRYHELRANLLQTRGKWQEAIDSYKQAVELGAGKLSETNRDLCASLRLRSKVGGMTPALWLELAQRMRDQGRYSEAKYVMGQLGGKGSVLANAIRSALKKDGITVRHLVCDDKGNCDMEISVRNKDDLKALLGFKVRSLTIHRDGKGMSLDLSPLSGMPLEELYFNSQLVSDLGSLRGTPLQKLSVAKNAVKDLTPLRGMKLTYLNLNETQIADLSSLKGMPLKTLNIHSCESLKDISPLRELPLERLHLGKDRGRRATPVTDFSPIAGLSLKYLDLSNNPHVNNLDMFKNSPLETLNLANCRNIEDFSLLQGKPLTSVNLENTRFSSINLLKGMKLTTLNLRKTQVSDLKDLAGIPLTSLNISETSVRQLHPLRGMKLNGFNMGGTKANDLNALRGMPLVTINITNAPVHDLRPLVGMPLRSLDLTGTRVRDLGPMSKMTVRYFRFVPTKGIRNVEALRKTKWLRQINGQDIKDFWRNHTEPR